jgi:hypothetical protein
MGGPHLVVAVQPGETCLSILEDGSGGIFAPSSWESLTAALSKHGPFEIPRTERGFGFGFEVVWLPG